MAGQNDPAKVLGIWGPKGPINVMEVGSSTKCSCINMQRKFFLCKSMPFFLLGSRTFNPPAFTRSIKDPKFPVYMTRDHPAIIYTYIEVVMWRLTKKIALCKKLAIKPRNNNMG